MLANISDTPTKVHDWVSLLVSAAIGDSDTAGISEMLKTLTRAVAAVGCVFWELTPRIDLGETESDDFLFPLAQWFHDHNICNSKPPLQSEIGQAVLQKKSMCVDDLSIPPHGFIAPEFLTRAGIRSMFSVRIAFQDKAQGALSLFSKETGGFQPADIATIEYLASFVPPLYQAIRDKIGLSLVQEIDRILNRTEQTDLANILLNQEVRRDYRIICDRISETFQCVETSIFLEDPHNDPAVYQLAATTWPEPILRDRYRRDPHEGLTSWVLHHATPVRIFDLRHFEDDQEEINKEYPGIVWTDSLQIRSAIKDLLPPEGDGDLQPLSFMAAPLVMREEVLGIIRCCTVKEDSYFFARRELDLLRLAAARISSYEYLAKTIDRLRKSDSKLAIQVAIQSQIQEDLSHQLKNPILQAYIRANSMLKVNALDNVVRTKLQAIRGLCNKAMQVSTSIGLFAALARGERVKVSLAPLWYGDLRKMLIESAVDNELMVTPSRRIYFRVNPESLDSLPSQKTLTYADHDLLQQAINNLLDNAGKYSFPNTVVRISIGYDTDGCFFISVTNEGLPISPLEIQSCVRRGWRSIAASQTVGEGSGIGLWIADHIMKAHQGKLLVFATTARHLTEVRLVFPKRERRAHENFAGRR